MVPPTGSWVDACRPRVVTDVHEPRNVPVDNCINFPKCLNLPRACRLVFTNRLACRFKLPPTGFVVCSRSLGPLPVGRPIHRVRFFRSAQSLCTRRTTPSRCRVTVLFPEFGLRTPPPEHADFRFPETVGLGRLRLRTGPHDGPSSRTLPPGYVFPTLRKQSGAATGEVTA